MTPTIFAQAQFRAAAAEATEQSCSGCEFWEGGYWTDSTCSGGAL